MSLSIVARWLIILALAAADMVGLRFTGMGLETSSFLRLGAALLTLLSLALIYTRWRPRERLADLAQTGAQLLLLFAAAAVFSYVLTVTALPLQDELFARADAFLGFDWLAWFRVVDSQPLLRGILHLAYITATPQLVAIALYLALAGRSEGNAELVWTLAFSLLLIIPLSALLPGAGAFVRYDLAGLVDASFVPEFAALRRGAISVIDLGRAEGVITFPSFHTTLAILFPYVVRRNRWVFASVTLLNLAMLISIPSEGGHYLVDVIAGAMVAAFAILAAPRVERRLGAPLRSAALSAAE